MKYAMPALAILALGPLTACTTQEAITTTESEIATTTSETAEQTDRPISSARGHSKAAFFDKYDINGDGKVSEAEFMGEREDGYRRRDANGDGQVHAEEYVSEYEVRLLKQMDDQRTRQIDQADFRFTVLDKNEDRNLSLDEFHASGSRMFSALDTNEDGIVDELDDAENY